MIRTPVALIFLVSLCTQVWATAPAPAKPVVKEEAVHHRVEIDVDRVDENIEALQSRAEQAGIHCRQWVDARIDSWNHWSGNVNRSVDHAAGSIKKEKKSAGGLLDRFHDAWQDVKSLFTKS